MMYVKCRCELLPGVREASFVHPRLSLGGPASNVTIIYHYHGTEAVSGINYDVIYYNIYYIKYIRCMLYVETTGRLYNIHIYCYLAIDLLEM